MFHLYRVNPPLPRMVGAIPVLLMNPKTNWNNYQMHPFSRETIPMGVRFAKSNGARTFRLFTVARLACIPFSLLGAYVCYRWAAEVWGYSGALVSLIVWTFNPMVLGLSLRGVVPRSLQVIRSWIIDLKDHFQGLVTLARSGECVVSLIE